MEVHLPKEYAAIEREINRALAAITSKFKESEELPLIASIRKPTPHQQNKRALSVQRLLVNNRKRLVMEDQGQLYYVDLTPVELINDPNSESDTVATASYVTATASSSLPNDRVLTQTSNQVIVTDNGAGSTIVLSLPQDYHTSATPQLARLGLGNAADGTASLKTAGAVIIGGDLDHDGSAIGEFGVTPAARPAAYTQTYATATRTHAARTAATLTDNSGGSANTTVQALTDPADTPLTANDLRDDLVANLIPELRNNFADLVAQVNALKADSDNTAQVINQIVDDFQLRGSLQ